MQQGFIGGNAALRVRVAGGVLLVAHLAFVAWYTLRPLDVPWVVPANLHPLAGIRADLALGLKEAARRIGAGLALPMAHGRLWASTLGSLVRTSAAGALISLGIALLQTGVPGQVVDIDSLLLNTAGVALAHLAVVPAARHWLRRGTGRGPRPSVRQEEPAQGRTPTIPRVGIAP